MKTFCLLLVVLLGTAMADKPCCYPDTFVIGKGSVAGFSERHGKDGSASTDGVLAFDYTNKRAAELFTMYVDLHLLSKYHIIYDYAMGTKYTLDLIKSKCWKEPLSTEMEHCVYANATFYMDAYLGDKKYNITNFGYFVKDFETQGQVSISVSKEECIPGSFVFLGTTHKVSMTSITGYYNYVNAIEDPDIYFKVPDECDTKFMSKGSPPDIQPKLSIFM